MERRQRRKSLSDRFIIWLLAVLKGSFIGRFFTSYENSNKRFEKIFGRKSYVGEKKFAKFIEKNRLINLVPSVVRYLMRISLRDYGIIMFLTGVPVAVLYSINNRILVIDGTTFEMFVLGTAVSLCSIPLMFSSKSLAKNITASLLFSRLLFDYLGMDDEALRNAAEENEVRFTIPAILIGFGFGIASYFILPTTTLLIVLLLILAYCTLRTPEVGVIITIFSIPFVSIETLCAFLAFTFIAFLIKVRLGKRIFKFEYFDLWIAIVAASFLFCGINYRDPLSSFTDVATNFIVMMSYFLFTNIVCTKEWFRRSMVSFTSTSLIVAIIAIAQKLYLELCESFEVLSEALPLGDKVTATLGDSTVLAQFMVLAVPFAIVHMLSERKEVTKFGGFLLAALFITALFFADSPIGYVGLLVGILLVFAFFMPKNIYLIIIVAIALPALYFILPAELKAIIVSAGPLKGVSIRNSLENIKELFLLALQYPMGVRLAGLSIKDVFGSEYIDSLPIQVLANYGIVAFVALILMLVMFSRVIMSYAVKAKNEYRRINGCAGLCTVLGLLAVGTFSYVWLDKRVFLVFMVIIALSFSYIKVEREDEPAPPKYIDFLSATLEIKLKEVYVYEPDAKSKYLRLPKVKVPKKNRKPEFNVDLKLKEFPKEKEQNSEKTTETETAEEKIIEGEVIVEESTVETQEIVKETVEETVEENTVESETEQKG